ncbi:MAG: leucine-rich repeat protein [Acutalibacteraceae bacterium]
MKRFLKSSLSLVLALTMILSSALVGLGELDFSRLFAVKASAASVDDLTIRYNNDGKTCYVYDCSSTASGELVIPSTYYGLTVTSIGSQAFKECKGLTSVTIPDSVTSIGVWAFRGCESLASVTIPDSVTSIDKEVFDGTAYYNDESNWVDGVLYIGNHLIKAKNTVNGDYAIKDGTKTIADSAFDSCTSLTSVIIPAGVTIINDFAFSDCEKLISVTIPDSVTSIGRDAFYDCTSLASVTIPDNVTSIGAYTFCGCSSLTSITIPDSVTSIGEWAFRGCNKFTTITIPKSVTSIGNYAFCYCIRLTSVIISDGVTSIGEEAFYNCRRLINVAIPDSVTSIGDYAFGCYYDYDLNEEKTVNGFTIEGHKGSAAEAYANKNGFAFIDVLHTHTLSDWITDKEATCIEDGSKHRECTSCGEVLETETLVKAGHKSSEWITDKEATCIETGLRHKECTVCGSFVEVEYLPTIDVHISSSWIIDKEATCTAVGSKHKECTVCGEVLETATIPQLTCSEPKLTKIENASNGIKVTWGKVTGAQSYNIYRKTYSNGKWSGWSAIKTGVTGTSYTDTTAKSGTTYTYTVRAKNAAGLSSYNTTGLKIKFLSTPKLTSISNGSDKVTVKWDKVTGASGYYVYRQTYSNGKWSGWKKVATTKDNYYNDTKVSSGNYYKYTVRAYNGSYISYYNTTGLKTKYLAVAPLKSAVSQKDGIKVTWGKVTGAKGYNIYRQTYSNGKWSGWTKIKTISSGSTVSYTDKSSKKGVTYKYTVRATSDSYMGYYNTKGLQVKDKY